MNEIKYKKGVGLDLGTNAIVRARLVETDEVVTTWIRDAFLNLKPTNKIVQNTMRKGLEKAGISFLEKDDCFIIIGDDALNAAVERGLTTQRPMSKGVVSPREAQALPIFKVLIKKVLGTPVEENEVCVYSVPASPVDAPFDSDFHSSMINAILNGESPNIIQVSDNEIMLRTAIYFARKIIDSNKNIQSFVVIRIIFKVIVYDGIYMNYVMQFTQGFIDKLIIFLFATI